MTTTIKNLQIFTVFFRVGAFTLGGGLAMISVLRHEIIIKRAWMGEEEFAREFALATAMPGAIVVNFSLFSGYKLRGASGAAAAFLGTTLPAFIAILAVTLFLFPYFGHPAAAAFLRGAAAAVSGLLAHTAFTMCKPLAKRAGQMAAALIAAGLATVPTVNPIFALILVSAAFFHLSTVRESRDPRKNLSGGKDSGIGNNGLNNNDNAVGNVINDDNNIKNTNAVDSLNDNNGGSAAINKNNRDSQ